MDLIQNVEIPEVASHVYGGYSFSRINSKNL